MRRLRLIGFALVSALAVAGGVYLNGAQDGGGGVGYRDRLSGRGRDRLSTGGWDAALRLLNPPGAGYDSTNISLSTASGGAVTLTSATPRQYCPDSSGALRSLAANKPCVVDGLALKVRSSSTNNLLQTGDLNNAAWTRTNLTFSTDGTLAPDGTAAQKVAATASVATLLNQAAAVAATSATCSVYVKKGSGATDANRFIIRNSTSATILVALTLNYDTLALTYTTGSGATATQTTNGWIRLAIPASSGIVSGNSIQCYVGYDGTAETAGEFAYFAHPQLTPGSSVPGDYCPTTTGAVTCSAETATVATPASLSRTEGCACMNLTPGWTGNPPTQPFYLSANALNTARLGYSSTSADSFIAFDGTHAPEIAAGFTNGVSKRYCTRWSAAGNFLTVENKAAGTSATTAFTTFPAFDANTYVGSRADGTLQMNARVDSLVLGRSPTACN